MSKSYCKFSQILHLWVYGCILYGADNLFFFVTGYQEKLFFKMTSVLAQSTNKVRLANNEISHACFKTDENILIKIWKVINGWITSTLCTINFCSVFFCTFLRRQYQFEGGGTCLGRVESVWGVLFFSSQTSMYVFFFKPIQALIRTWLHSLKKKKKV